MTVATLIFRSLLLHWRTHLGVAAGTAVATAVLAGALLVGDSVDGTLRDAAAARIGRAGLAMATGARYFRAALADDVSRELRLTAAPMLATVGWAQGNTGASAIDVQVLGVDERFWSLSLADGEPGPLRHGEAILNERLAGRLGVTAGQAVRLSLPHVGELPLSAPLSGGSVLSPRLTVAGVADDAHFGKFGLSADAAGPLTAMVPLEWLQQRLELPGRANVILVRAGATPAAADAAVAAHLQLADAQLRLRTVGDEVELVSGRVFMGAAEARAALAAAPDGRRVMAYFVNELRCGQATVPYSMVAAVESGAGLTPVQTGQIVLNTWARDQLDAKVGDEVAISYYRLGEGGLREQSTRLGLTAVTPIEGVAADRTLMPDFPGLADVEDCGDWKPGVVIDLGRIRPQDEQYWRDYRGTPKAFISLDDAQRMWGNAFGELTAIRWQAAGGLGDRLAAEIPRRLEPGQLGMRFADVGTAAKSAAPQTDFGGLFAGMSFFLLSAALVLVALLWALGISQRTAEIGTLLALGLSPRLVGRLLLWESAVVVLLGTAAGAGLALVYTKLMLWGLATIWRPAGGGMAFSLHASATALAGGVAAAAAMALAAAWLALARQIKRRPHELLGGGDAEVAAPHVSWRGVLLSVLSAVAAPAIVVTMLAALATVGSASAPAFFAGGVLMLAAYLGMTYGMLSLWGRALHVRQLTAARLGLRNAGRRRWRSLAVVAATAMGVFIVVAVGAFRQPPPTDYGKLGPTGGFALVARTATDVLDGDGRSLPATMPADLHPMVSVVGLKVHSGESASCVNIARAAAPAVWGVEASRLAGRFELSGGASWSVLDEPRADGSVPAIGDETSVTWSLGRQIGDVVEVTDELGAPVRLRIVATVKSSMLQGGLIISGQRFARLWPSQGGYRLLLIDAPPELVDDTAGMLRTRLATAGVEVMPATHRLGELQAVQNTYIAIFQLLGGLGLVLASVGMAAVVARNVMERRGELGLLAAVGFSRGRIRWMIVAEHAALLAGGVLSGAISAAVATLPSLLALRGGLPWASMGITTGGVLAMGLLWVWLAGWLATRGQLVAALRSE
jgi:ABC-type antimicrobial peptide transport system permease subunit